MDQGKHILFRHRDIANLRDLDVYLAHGGFEAFKKAGAQVDGSHV